MESKIHKLLYYCNARHSIDVSMENIHSHTFTIGLYIEDRIKDRLLDINKVNRTVNNYLDQYREILLNRKPAFQYTVPTIEHIGDFFYDELRVILSELSCNLIQFDISENPLKIYSVSERLFLSRL